MRTLGCLLAFFVVGFVVVVAAAVAHSTGLEKYLPALAVIALVASFAVWLEWGIRSSEPRGGSRAERRAAFLARQARQSGRFSVTRWLLDLWLGGSGRG